MSSTTAAYFRADRTATAPRPAALPYLSVANARAAIDWYTDAFGATLVGDPIVMDDGRIGHAEIAIAGGVLYLADEHPELGLKAPAPRAVSVSLMLHVADTDAALHRAREHGATVEREIYESYGTRNATIIDPFGHRWMLSGPVTLVAGIQHGDIGYVSVWTPDADRAAAFYRHVLGWIYDPGGHRVTNTELPTGISASAGPPTLFCCYAVDDVLAARAAIAEAGGVPGRSPRRRLRRPARRHRPAGCGVRGLSAARRTASARSSTAPGPASFVCHLRGAGFGRASAISTAACWAGPSSPAASPTAGRCTGAPDGRRRRRQRHPDHRADVDGSRYRRGRRAGPRSRRHRAGRTGPPALRRDRRMHRRSGRPLYLGEF